jgi:hypothetical protein
MKRLGFAFAALVLSLAVALLVGEAWLRVASPTPRRVVVRESAVGPFGEARGLPTWYSHHRWDSPAQVARRRDTTCDGDPASFRVVVVGDSILHGLSVPFEDVATTRLAEGLRARAPGVRVCVRNLAEPGYGLAQMLAVGRDAVASTRPQVVLVELWAVARFPYRVGGTVYQLAGDPDDPTWGRPFGLPHPLQRALLRTSALYELAFNAAPDPRLPAEGLWPWFDRELRGLRDDVAAHGGVLVGVLPADLSNPWDRQLDGIEEAHRRYEAWGAASGVRTVRFAELLHDVDPREVAMDPVHLDERGQRLLGGRLVDVVGPVLDSWRAAQVRP